MKLYSLFIFTQRFLQRARDHDATVPCMRLQPRFLRIQTSQQVIRVWYNKRLLFIIFVILRVYKVSDNNPPPPPTKILTYE